MTFRYSVRYHILVKLTDTPRQKIYLFYLPWATSPGTGINQEWGDCNGPTHRTHSPPKHLQNTHSSQTTKLPKTIKTLKYPKNPKVTAHTFILPHITHISPNTIHHTLPQYTLYTLTQHTHTYTQNKTTYTTTHYIVTFTHTYYIRHFITLLHTHPTHYIV